jgi:hypothetical protein
MVVDVSIQSHAIVSDFRLTAIGALALMARSASGFRANADQISDRK